MTSIRALAAFFVLFASLSHAQQLPAESPQERDQRLAWWRDARFGMFIHWGPVSLKGTEIGWSRGREVPTAEYDNLYKQFNPTRFDAAAWVSTAKAAGMKYIVLTSKHHDGFCLWDSKLTDYTMSSTPFKRDIVRELADECRRQGIRFCLYHSILDWRHPDYPLGDAPGGGKKQNPQMDRYIPYLKGQLKELLTNYGPLGLLWFDGEWEEPWTHDMGLDLYNYCRSLQPNLIINNRVDKGRNDMKGTTKTGDFSGDYDTPEQEVGRFNFTRPWESCITICNQWAWKPNDDMKSLEQCLHTLITCAGGDGNLLFNVGPMPTGEIEPRQVQRLKEMGQWLEKYGQTIYATRGGPWIPGRWGVSTRKADRVYLHILNGSNPTLTLPAPTRRKILSAHLLTGGFLTFQAIDGNITFNIPLADRHPIDTIIELQLDGPALDEPALTGPPPLTTGKKATASNTFQNNPAYAPDKALDNDPATRWATDAGTHQAWLEIDLGQPTPFSRVIIEEAYPGRVQSFELQSRDGDAWKTFLRGTTLGASYEQSFPPLTARHIRLNILRATEGPTLSEFSLYPPTPSIAN
ncbi:MAG: alpha-L-fucosidase [Bacillota bacterium]